MEIDIDYSPVDFTRQSKWKKNSILLLILLGLSLVGLSLSVALHAIKWNTSNCTQNDSIRFCATPHCVKTANDLLETIDETADPCENFYQFTCGSWMQKVKLSDKNGRESSFDQLFNDMNQAVTNILSSPLNGTIKSKAVRNAHHFYNVCVNDLRTNEYSLSRIFTTILYETNIQYNTLPSSLSDALIKLNQYNTFLFFKVKTVVDDGDSQDLRYAIRLTPASRLHDEDDTDESHESLYTQTTTRNSSTLTSLFDFVKEINAHVLVEDADDLFNGINTTMKNLTQLMNSTFDFSKYIHDLYRLADISLSDNDTIIVYNIEDIRAIASILARQSNSILHDYMLANFVNSYKDNFLRNSSNEENSIEIKCAQYVNKHMNLAVGKLYIDKYFDDHTRHESIEIIENIRETFVDMVQRSTWMDEISKKRTIEKIKRIQSNIGYPDYLQGQNLTELDAEYTGYEFTSSYFRNVLLMRQYNIQRNLRKIRHVRTEMDSNSFSPTTLNAFYNPLLNNIILPAAILQPPMFRKDVPKYLNYGALGSIIGHEITHGFDESRRHLNVDRSIYTLWSKETSEIYEKRSKCIVDQYNNYNISKSNIQVHGAQTLNENIADTDGLKKAFYAYQKWKKTHKINEEKMPGLQQYSDEQMFFISYGQIYCSKINDFYTKKATISDYDHAPPKFRLIGSTSNFIEFDRAFNCQNNTRKTKCKVW